jgi:hypothetical protein
MTRPPLQDVVRIVYVRGARGGRQVALVLACGHWMTRRRPPQHLSKGIACTGCLVQRAIDAEAETKP